MSAASQQNPVGGQGHADGLPVPRRRWAVATLLLAMTMAVLDASIANVALPTIAVDLDASPAAAVWIVNAYNVTVVAMLLPLSSVAERVGFKRMFVIGLSLFTLASLACALSRSLEALTLSRIAQGLGAAVLMSLFGGLVRHIYPTRMLARGISINAMTVGVMSVLGPTIGAAILSVAQWPWIFAVNLPVGLVALRCARFLPDVPGTGARFDWASALLCMVGMSLFILGIDYLVAEPVRGLGLVAAAAAAAWFLVRRARGQTAPLVPVDLLRIKPVAYAVGASACSFAAQMSAFVSLPFYLQHVLGRDHLSMGFLLGMWPVAAAAMAPVSARLCERYSAAQLCAAGAAAMAAGLAWLAALPPDAGNAAIVVGMLLGGIGFGFFQTPNNRAMLGSAPRSRAGAAGGMQATTRVFGQSFGTALVAAAFGLSREQGPTLALIFSMGCALMALAVNAVRIHRDRLPAAARPAKSDKGPSS